MQTLKKMGGNENGIFTGRQKQEKNISEAENKLEEHEVPKIPLSERKVQVKKKVRYE